jgi:hypothetical protein
MVTCSDGVGGPRSRGRHGLGWRGLAANCSGGDGRVGECMAGTGSLAGPAAMPLIGTVAVPPRQ